MTVHRCLQIKAGAPVPRGLLHTYFGCRQHAVSVFALPAARPASSSFHDYHHSMFGRRTSSVVGPMTWNSMPDNLGDPAHSDDKLRASLKTNDVKSSRTSLSRGQNFVLVLVLEDLSSALALSICPRHVLELFIWAL